MGLIMQIQIDTREHKKERERIEQQLDALRIQHYRSKLYVGDYMSLDNPRLVVDRKKDLQELCQNVTKQHERFTNELKRAREQGISVVILCEHGPDVNSLADVFFWTNPRRKDHKFVTVNGKPKYVFIPEYKRALSGQRLYHILSTIRDRYDVKFEFCDKDQTGQRIVELLGGDTDGERMD